MLKERDELKSRLVARKRENQVLQEKLANVNRMIESMKGETPVDQRVAELQVGVAYLVV